MKIQPTVRKETLRIAAGTVILSAVMVLIFALLKRFDYTVVLGALLGSCAAVANFFLLALSVQKAAEMMNGVELPPEPEEDEQDDEKTAAASAVPEVKQAKQRMQLSYTARMIMMGAVGIIGLTVPCFHAVAVVIPFLFPRFIIHFWHARMNQQKEE